MRLPVWPNQGGSHTIGLNRKTIPLLVAGGASRAVRHERRLHLRGDGHEHRLREVAAGRAGQRRAALMTGRRARDGDGRRRRRPRRTAWRTPPSTDVFDWLRFVDETFSTYKPESEICRIERGELSPAERSSRRAARCWSAARSCARRPAATSTPRPAAASIPPASSRAGRSTAAAAILEARGRAELRDLRGRRRHRPRAPRARTIAGTSGIRHPRARGPGGGRRRGRPTSPIATSGAYARGDHVVDPHTGRPPSGPALGDDHRPGARDGRRVRDGGVRRWAQRGPAWTAQLDGYEALSILESGTVLSTPGFPALG